MLGFSLYWKPKHVSSSNPANILTRGSTCAQQRPEFMIAAEQFAGEVHT